MKNTVIILGSSNSHGNTRKIINEFLIHHPARLIDLNQYKISYFDYEHKNQNDDFLPLITDLLKYDEWIFATPVYWYSMSAVMKTFFDRISDLLKIRKDLGRQLRAKTMKIIVCSSNSEFYEYFEKPFEASANYLGMNYYGMLWSWIEDGTIPEIVNENLRKFIKT